MSREKDNRENFRRVKLQTVARPPSRREVESWLKVREIMTRKKEDDNEKSPSPSPMEQSQYVKMRVRQNSDDSMGSEMTLSLPSLTSDNEDEEASDNNTVKVPLEPTENCDRSLSQTSDCDMFATSPSPPKVDNEVVEGDDVEDEVEVGEDSFDDSLVIPPSPQNDQTLSRSLRRSQVKKRRLSWDLTADIEAKLAESPGFRNKFATPEAKRFGKSQIEATSPATPKPMIDLAKVKVSTSSYLTMLCLELFIQTRHHLKPDPEFDNIVAAFYRVMSADDDWDPVSGVIVVGDKGTLEPSCVYNQKFVETELQLVNSVVRLVRDVDPDILAGYEVQMASWGFLASRAATLNINLCPLLSRVPASVRESKVKRRKVIWIKTEG